MLKKIASLVCFLMLALSMQADAVIQSDYDAANKAKQVSSIASYDFFKLFNKSELIGYNLTDYNIATAQYRQSALATVQDIQSSLSQINMVRSDTDLTDEAKALQINRLYQSIDSALYSLDSQTLNYIYSLRTIMPTITYQRFVKKFEEYYNSLNLTDNEITLD